MKGAGANHAGHHAKRGVPPAPPRDARVQEVWTNNLEDEILKIQDIAEEFSHVALDALLPGIVAQPTGPFGDYGGYNYQTLRCNVDLTRIIQMGLTLSDAEGNRPEGISTWRFNFVFDAGSDLVSPELMDRLRHHFDLVKHQREGIQVSQFGELLMSSGLVLNEDIRWISYCGSSCFSERPVIENGSSGCADWLSLPWVSFSGLYNFGHLLHLLTSQSLPDGIEGFYEALDLFFPCRCDIAKHLHHLPQLSGRDPSDIIKRPLFCNANHLIEAFFRLPDAVRWKAFDRTEDACGDGKPQRDSEAHRQEPSGVNGSAKTGGG